MNIQNVIELVYNDFCTYFHGVDSSVNNAVAFGECGRYTHVLHI